MFISNGRVVHSLLPCIQHRTCGTPLQSSPLSGERVGENLGKTTMSPSARHQ